ncbi:hypothetical protein C7H84_31230 [Burkholderia sp. Nafp2/4-1b]|nr:hypothetical protein C7H84_31230 [Burkholderia sp. Nafp2/4-1b]
MLSRRASLTHVGPGLRSRGDFCRTTHGERCFANHGRARDLHRVLLGMIAAQQSVYYLELAERRPANETFEYGWQLNRALGG